MHKFHLHANCPLAYGILHSSRYANLCRLVSSKSYVHNRAFEHQLFRAMLNREPISSTCCDLLVLVSTLLLRLLPIS